MRDFLFLRCLSIGGASRVFLCERKDSGEKVAVKAMRKADVQRKNSVHRVWRERAILSMTSHPFIVPMYYAIASRHHLYLIMEYMRGGDLAGLPTHLHHASRRRRSCRAYWRRWRCRSVLPALASASCTATSSRRTSAWTPRDTSEAH